jgi:hypothetical protein
LIDLSARNAGFLRACGYICNREKAKQQQRFVPCVSRNVFLPWRHQQGVTRLQRIFTAFRKRRSLAGKHVNAFFEIGMMVGRSRRFARPRHWDFRESQGDALRASFTRDNFERFTAGEFQLFRACLREEPRHQRTLST